jgi:hypothetical protein
VADIFISYASPDRARASTRRRARTSGVSRFSVKRGAQELVLEIECPGCVIQK